MEYKLVNKCSLFLILALVFQSCGLFENDKIDFQKPIVGNILIQRQENVNVTNLVYKETNEIYAVIVDDCLRVYYNSEEMVIYVEAILNEADRRYYQVDILDPSSKFISSALNRKLISKKLFDSKINVKLKKWESKK